MSKRSNRDDAGEQPAMFTFQVDKLAQSLAIEVQPRWLYPCGLCNGRQVPEPGGLCSVCAPTPPRTRRKTAKKATAKKAAESTTGRRSRAKRVPPWDRVADGGAS